MLIIVGRGPPVCIWRSEQPGSPSDVQAKYTDGISPGQLRNGAFVDALNSRDMTDRIVFGHVKGVIGTNGHVVTNQHVVDGCVGDIQGNLTGEAPATLRVVSTDETNDLALLQVPGSFKEVAKIKDRAVQSGDSVIAIGFPFHGLLTSDFTVTTGIVSSLRGLLNDTRFLQISAAVQPGNSGGPLLAASGDVVGVVAAKLNALKVVRATGSIPEDINFAIKTAALRDFLDNSVVPYQISDAKTELKTTDIARNARAFTLQISRKAKAKNETAKN